MSEVLPAATMIQAGLTDERIKIQIEVTAKRRRRYLNNRTDTHMNNEQKLYLEDLYVGQRFTSSSYRMDEEQIKAFAAQFDPQSFHLDHSAAQMTIFGGLAASGWHTAAVAMRLLVTGGLPLGNGIIGLGGELSWPNPTRPGDTLHVESEIMEVVPSRSKPNQAIVKVKSTTTNQDGQPVHVFTSKVLVFKRS